MWSIQEQSGEVYDLVNSVVLEEMLHMGLACNMLRGIGGSPQITPPAYPGPLPGGVRPELEVYLAGLSSDTVQMYMQIEMPEHPLGAAAVDYPTIGAFYDAILAAFQALSPPIDTSGQLGAELSVDVPDPPGPSRTVEEDLTPVGSLADVEQAIATIKDQGEGTSLSPDAPEYGGELAHYYRFGEIYHGRQFVPTPEGWQWAGDPVEFPACYPVAKVPAGGYPDVPESQAFDQTFSELVGHLENAWGTGGQNDLNQAIGMMFRLYNLAQPLITTALPGGGGNYGPDFIPAS
jgi:ferritin-like protein